MYVKSRECSYNGWNGGIRDLDFIVLGRLVRVVNWDKCL